MPKTRNSWRVRKQKGDRLVLNGLANIWRCGPAGHPFRPDYN